MCWVWYIVRRAVVAIAGSAAVLYETPTVERTDFLVNIRRARPSKTERGNVHRRSESPIYCMLPHMLHVGPATVVNAQTSRDRWCLQLRKQAPWLQTVITIFIVAVTTICCVTTVQWCTPKSRMKKHPPSLGQATRDILVPVPGIKKRLWLNLRLIALLLNFSSQLLASLFSVVLYYLASSFSVVVYYCTVLS